LRVKETEKITKKVKGRVWSDLAAETPAVSGGTRTVRLVAEPGRAVVAFRDVNGGAGAHDDNDVAQLGIFQDNFSTTGISAPPRRISTAGRSGGP
jgi:hypothetical protein